MAIRTISAVMMDCNMSFVLIQIDEYKCSLSL